MKEQAVGAPLAPPPLYRQITQGEAHYPAKNENAQLNDAFASHLYHSFLAGKITELDMHYGLGELSKATYDKYEPGTMQRAIDRIETTLEERARIRSFCAMTNEERSAHESKTNKDPAQTVPKTKSPKGMSLGLELFLKAMADS